jgi:hypothetical protein
MSNLLKRLFAPRAKKPQHELEPSFMQIRLVNGKNSQKTVLLKETVDFASNMPLAMLHAEKSQALCLTPNNGNTDFENFIWVNEHGHVLEKTGTIASVKAHLTTKSSAAVENKIANEANKEANKEADKEAKAVKQAVADAKLAQIVTINVYPKGTTFIDVVESDGTRKSRTAHVFTPEQSGVSLKALSDCSTAHAFMKKLVSLPFKKDAYELKIHDSKSAFTVSQDLLNHKNDAKPASAPTSAVPASASASSSALAASSSSLAPVHMSLQTALSEASPASVPVISLVRRATSVVASKKSKETIEEEVMEKRGGMGKAKMLLIGTVIAGGVAYFFVDCDMLVSSFEVMESFCY